MELTDHLMEMSEGADPGARDVLLDAIEKSWEHYLTELERCRTEFSNDAVHDLRVAARRMMAVIRLLNSIESRPRLRKIIRGFKEQLGDFDDLRDTQVILAEISDAVRRLPGLQAFQEHEQSLEEKLLNTLQTRIEEFRTDKLSKRIRKTRDALKRQKEEELDAEILQAVDDAYLVTKQRLGWVDLAQPATIHRVRVAFKSLRYMIEIVQPLLNDFPPVHLEWMNNYQSLMGEVQDAEVFRRTLTAYLESASVPKADALRRYAERRHSRAISAYAADMNQLQIFWRPAPDQPFPWEAIP